MKRRKEKIWLGTGQKSIDLNLKIPEPELA